MAAEPFYNAQINDSIYSAFAGIAGDPEKWKKLDQRFMDIRAARKIRIAVMLCMAFALCMFFGGCTPEKKGGTRTIGISMPSKAIERWSRDGEYLKDRFESQGYDVELRYSDEDINHQIEDIQVLIADDVDLLIVVAVDGSALFRTLEDADYKNIPVIAYDRLIMDSDAVDCYVSFDNYQVGVLQAQFIADELGLENSEETYSIELVSGDPADNNAVFFYNGARSVLDPYLDSGKLNIPSGKLEFLQTSTPNWSTDKAFENMQNILASYYSDRKRLDAVLCASDALSLGASQALMSDYAGGNMPVITGQDADVAALQNIVDGRQTMTIFKNVKTEANMAVEVAEAILNGEELTSSLAEDFTDDCVFDTSSYDNGSKIVPSYLLVPEVITAGNLDTLVGTGLYKWDRDRRYLVAE